MEKIRINKGAMRLCFTGLKKSPTIFKQLRGISVVEFEKVVEKITQGWE